MKFQLHCSWISSPVGDRIWELPNAADKGSKRSSVAVASSSESALQRCHSERKRSEVEEPLISVGSGGAEQCLRRSSAPPLPAKVRGSSTALRFARNDNVRKMFSKCIASKLAASVAARVSGKSFATPERNRRRCAA